MDNQASPAPVATHTPSSRQHRLRDLILLLLSTVLLVLAFLPICSIHVADGNNEFTWRIGEFTWRIGAVDSICFFFDSGKNLSWEEEEESKLYQDITKLEEEMRLMPRTSMKFKSLASKYMTKSLRLDVQSEEFSAPLFFTTSMLVSLLFLLVSLALFVFSLIHFIFSRQGKRSYEALCLTLLFSIPILVFLMYFALTPYSVNRLCLIRRMSVPAILSIVLPILFAAYLIVKKCKNSSFKGFRITLSSPTVKNALSLGCVVLVLLLLPAPVLNSQITQYRFNVSVSDNMCAEEAAEKYHVYKEMSLPISPAFFSHRWDQDDSYGGSNFVWAHNMHAILQMSEAEIELGYANSENYSILGDITGSIWDGFWISPMFSLIYYVLLILGIIAGLIGVQNIRYLCAGKNSRLMIRICKITCIVIAAIFVILWIMFILKANEAIKDIFIEESITSYEYYEYRLTPAVGPFVLIAACIGMLLLPSKTPVIQSTEKPASDTEVTAG